MDSSDPGPGALNLIGKSHFQAMRAVMRTKRYRMQNLRKTYVFLTSFQVSWQLVKLQLRQQPSLQFTSNAGAFWRP